MNKPLKYIGHSIVFQEVPNEVSVAFNISCCPYKCKGCHSLYLWEDEGEYLLKDLPSVLEEYGELITCVCFMGGDQNMLELIEACKIAKSNGLKTCLYSGCDDFSQLEDVIQYLNYVKTGSYKENLGGLNSSKTNQRFYRLINHEFEDITKWFQNKTIK